MNTFTDIFSYVALVCLFVAFLVPMIALIISKGNEIKRLDELEKLKKSSKGTASVS
ncbi:MAG TPA: hypothetical protein VG737_12475 [Cyclobacteriaceae bacterium]|nr:hypothetical protein [Cyclobacteriaceae bacterium]